MKCPNCWTIVPVNAKRCDCGHVFKEGGSALKTCRYCQGQFPWAKNDEKIPTFQKNVIVCASYYGGFVCKKCEAKPEVREEEDQADPLWDIKKAKQATPAYQNLVRLAKKMDTEEGKKAYFRAANQYTNGKLSKLLKNGGGSWMEN